MDKFVVVCVLYNSTISEIASIDVFKELGRRHENVDIVIVDNTEDQRIKELSTE